MKIRCCTMALLLFVAGCSSSEQHKTTSAGWLISNAINLASYTTPFGASPDGPDLTQVFLSLPSELVGDLSLRNRKSFILQCGTKGRIDVFDPENRYASYCNCNDEVGSPIEVSSMFELKIFLSSKYRYIVAIHMGKPFSLETPPAATNTFVLAPTNGRWINVTEQVLPKKVKREWYFEITRTKKEIPCGPYLRKFDAQAPNGCGCWRTNTRKYDLIWRDVRFEARAAASPIFESL